MQSKKLDMSATWNAVMAMLRASRDVMLPLAGLLFFLPIWGLFMKLAQADINLEAGEEQLNQELLKLFLENAPWIIILLLISQYGQTVMNVFFIDSKRLSLGDAMKKSAVIFLSCLAVMILVTFANNLDAFLPSENGAMIILGLFLKILGLFLGMRLIVSIPVLASGETNNPIKALSQSWRLTRGNFWPIFGLSLIIGLMSLLIGLAIFAIFGGMLVLLLPSGFGTIAALAVVAIIIAAFISITTLLQIAIYKQLAS